ncbi:MAG: T9SS type A sorting domain-containing protein, partial [Pedobacter sp.]|nr:T9SS type A sorting domain-containing protein [Pedobacter sp.]
PLAVPVANFSTSFSSACVNVPFVLADQSSNMPSTWSWTLTGGSPALSSVKNPTVTFSSAGIYTVSLISTNGNGPSNVYTTTISVTTAPTISLSATSACNGQPANLTANGAFSYVWSNSDIGSNISVYPPTTSVYTCTGSVGACSSTQTINVNVGTVATPTITQTGLVLTSSASSGNQWYLNGAMIAGENAQTYTVTQNGFYSVWVTSPIGCQSSSSSVQVSITGFENLIVVNSISISPNPAKDILFINSSSIDAKKGNYTIYSVKGQLVKSGDIILNNKESISLSDLAAGIYEIQFQINQSKSSYKFIKE